MKDNRGREIDIEYQGDGVVVALHNGKEIGRIEVMEIEIDAELGHWFYRLESMDVEQVYQRAGIGTAMMKNLVDEIGSGFKRPSSNALGGSDKEAHQYFTEEGLAFIRRCIELGILPEDNDGDGDDIFHAL